MRILVTGGAGFLGANLVRELLNQGHQVVVYDDFSTGRWRNVQDLPVRVIEGRVQVLSTAMEAIFGDERFEQIYHLACPASPPQYMKDATSTLHTAFMGTDEALLLARHNYARLVVASTSEVYGEPLSHPQVEDHWSRINPLGPRSCYDLGKAAAESLVAAAWRDFGQDVAMARIFNTYGPYMDPDDGRVVSNFCCQAIQGKPITVYGDGKQTRSFCFVKDTVDGLVALMGSGECEVYNVGNPAERTVGFMAEKIRSMARSKSEIVYRDLPMDDPTRRRPDITKAMADIKWSPAVGIESGLQATIEYFREELRDV